MHFWLVSKQPDGSWRAIFEATGIPDFLSTKGADGWPDIRLGLPGLCFPIWRWSGKEYVINRREYDGKPCDLPKP